MGAGGGSRLFGRDIDCVWERGVRASERERERELATEREKERKRGGERWVVCVHKWCIDRETMLMLFEISLCTETQGKRVIVCVCV